MGEAHNEGGEPDYYAMPSYAGLGMHGNMMLAHIVFMVLAWIFILPIGVMFSVARSRYALPAQFLFLVLNGFGMLFGTIYNINTPDLYENNAHHKIGWIATWIVTAQVIMSLVFHYSGRGKQSEASTPERQAFLPVSTENMVQHNMEPYAECRWSGDSGQGTEASSTLNSRDASPTKLKRRNTDDSFGKPEPEQEPDDEGEEPLSARHRPQVAWLRINVIDKYLSSRVPNLLSAKILRAIEIVYQVIDRTILILGFIVLTTGVVTYAGMFRGNNVFNGLAHFIKGGIFFWYGLLTLGRWMGCFAEFGWAWNLKPTRSEVGQWKARIPSAEFVESFVIWLYGSTNVFLEHLAAWGHQWTAQDLEHVSISIMFFGGGLLGIMMSSHHQDSMTSTTVHKQWGNLLGGFAVARLVTYVIMYISPPSSVYPSRPPTELISAFCLISGGLVFMASTRDIIHFMEGADLMAMFVFTVVMGFTAFIMSYEVFVLCLKGWATRKELNAARSSVRY